MNQAGLYIHIPFCQAKCGYCSFNSLPGRRETADNYLDILKQQIEIYSTQPEIKALCFDTIFFGGGTPTLASPEKLADLLLHARDHFPCSADLEISIEANPNTLSLNDLTLLRQAGFNRLSLGVQSFDDTILKRLNRTHTGDQARQALYWAREVGFSNISCDLIYGLPEQTIERWQNDLQTILNLDPDHLSLYELSIEPGTAFHAETVAGTLMLPNDDLLADLEAKSKALLSPTYGQYEISNFCKEEKQCRHNLTYWHNGNYLGLGAGAVSCIDGLRFNHQSAPQLFTDAIRQGQSTISQVESLSPQARFRETMIMGLRLVQGVNLNQMEQHLNLSHQQVYGSLVDDLIAKGQLQFTQPYLAIPTPLLGVANQILHQLV